MRRMRRAFATLDEELRSMAEERKRFHLGDTSFTSKEIKPSPNGERADLLHNLVKAAIFDDGEIENGVVGPKGLSDNEIIGNTYIYYLAGHETTGS
jgi:cytochrome P450